VAQRRKGKRSLSGGEDAGKEKEGLPAMREGTLLRSHLFIPVGTKKTGELQRPIEKKTFRAAKDDKNNLALQTSGKKGKTSGSGGKRRAFRRVEGGRSLGGGRKTLGTQPGGRERNVASLSE